MAVNRPCLYSTNHRSNAMLEALVRFIEELIDVFNFGSSISK